MKLRPYQLQCIEATAKALETAKSCLNVSPTGTGKTVMIGGVAARATKRVMVCAHREELVTQNAHKIEKMAGEAVGIEMADRKADATFFSRNRIVSASVQTLISGTGDRRRMQKFDPMDFGELIFDEAHHCTADSYQQIIAYYRDRNPDIKIIGFTATPDRADEQAMGQVFETVSFLYELEDAINDGWLVPIKIRSVNIAGLDYSKVRTTAGDLNGADLANVMSSEEILQQVADATIREAGFRKTIIFAPPGFRKSGDGAFRVSERLAEILNRARDVNDPDYSHHSPDLARLVSQDTDKEVRRQIIKDYSSSLFQYFVNVGIATEGFDEPTIELVVLARATKSRALFSQMIGRGTRPLPGVVDGDGLDTPEARKASIAASAKPYIEIMDLVGVSGRHKLVTMADILGGKHSDEARERVKKKAEESDEPVDATRALEEAEEEIKKEKEAAIRAEAAKRAAVVGKAKYTSQSVDPFDVFDIQPERRNVPAEPLPVTEKQEETLAKYGIDTEGLDRNGASKLLEEVFRRFRKGLSSFKQIKLLQKLGYDGDPKTLGFKEASEAIDQLLHEKKTKRENKKLVPAGPPDDPEVPW